MGKENREEEAIRGYFDIKTLKRIISLMMPHKKFFIIAVIITVIVSAVDISLPIIIKQAVDDFILNMGLDADSRISGLTSKVFIFLGLLALYFVLNFTQIFLLNYGGQKTMGDLRDKVFCHFQNLRMSFFDHNPIGRLVTRNTNDIQALDQMFSEVLVYIIKDSIILIGVMAVVISYSFTFGMFLVAVFIILLISTMAYNVLSTSLFRRFRVLIARINAVLSEYIMGMTIIQLFNQQKRIKGDFSMLNLTYYDVWKKLAYVSVVYRPFASLMRSISIAMIIWYVGGGVIDDKLTLGELTAFIVYLDRFFHPIFHMTERVEIIKSAIVSGERVFKLLDTQEFIPQKPDAVHPAVFKPEIEFRDVCFAYNNDNYVLKNISFMVEEGNRVAVVGRTGSGKTSLINLLLRFYEFDHGAVSIGGYDIRELDVGYIRKNISYVMQDVYLFSGTVKDNIMFGIDPSHAKNLEEICHRMQLDYLISRLPRGLDTPVTERGMSFSSGERQLISFARALISNPSLIVLDEATSNIDSRTEHLIQLAIEELLRGRTSIIIAHRLSTIKNSNKILVMHKGRIVEEGNHSKLISLDGIYSKLYSLQKIPA